MTSTKHFEWLYISFCVAVALAAIADYLIPGLAYRDPVTLWIRVALVIGAITLNPVFFRTGKTRPGTAAPPAQQEDLIDLTAPGVEQSVLSGQQVLTPGQLFKAGTGRYSAFVEIKDGQILAVSGSTADEARAKYAALQRQQSEQSQPVQETTAGTHQAAQEPETDDSDTDAMLTGYKPQKWMLAERKKIVSFINRKLANEPIKGAINPKPWVVGECCASLNNVTILINTRGQVDKLYNQNFQSDLLSKLPDGARIEKHGVIAKYPAIVFPRRQREFIMTDQALNEYYGPQVKGFKAPFVGLDEQMQVVTVSLQDSPSVVVFGGTRSGKGVCLHNMMISLMAVNPPDRFQFIRCDPKGTEQARYNELPHMLGPVAVAPLEICDRVAWLIDEMNRRNDLFAEHKIEGIDDWNIAKGKQPLPFLVLAFDEMLDFFMALDREDDAKNHSDLVTGQLISLINKAASAGIFVICVTQVGDDPRLKKVCRGIKTVISFRAKEYALKQLVSNGGDVSIVERLTGKGHGVVFGDNVIEFQAPSTVIKDDDGRIVADCRDKIVSALKQKYFDHLPAEFIRIDPEPPDEKLNCHPDDAGIYLDVVHYVAENNEVKRKRIMEAFNIRGTKQADRIIKAMTDDGFISPSDGTRRPRKVLNKARDLLNKAGSKPDQSETNVILFAR